MNNNNIPYNYTTINHTPIKWWWEYDGEFDEQQPQELPEETKQQIIEQVKKGNWTGEIIFDYDFDNDIIFYGWWEIGEEPKTTIQKLNKIKELLTEASDLFDTLESQEQDRISNEHNEGYSLNYCLRWGLQAVEELTEDDSIK